MYGQGQPVGRSNPRKSPTEGSLVLERSKTARALEPRDKRIFATLKQLPPVYAFDFAFTSAVCAQKAHAGHRCTAYGGLPLHRSSHLTKSQSYTQVSRGELISWV